MRRLTDPARLAALMRALGHAARAPGRVYLTGGSTALLLGWRTSTMDVDLHLDPGAEPLLRELPRLKEELEINVELAAPSQFVPELPGWRERSLFIAREGSIDFYHYDLYSQALSKIERGHALDLEDVRQMIEREHVARPRLAELFVRVEPELYRYPAIDPATLRRRVAAICAA